MITSLVSYWRFLRNLKQILGLTMLIIGYDKSILITLVRIVLTFVVYYRIHLLIIGYTIYGF